MGSAPEACDTFEPATADLTGPAVECVVGASATETPGVDLPALAVRARDGDEEAFTRLAGECTGRLFSFLFRLTGHVQDAEDLVQDTLVKAFRALPRYDAARPWLPRLYTNAPRPALNHRRGKRAVEELPDELPSPGDEAGPGESAATRDEDASLWHLARRLNPRYHEVLWLHYGEGFPLPEVAAVMGANRFGVKVLLHRARRALLAEWRRSARPPERSTASPSRP